jgi:hypothetical protein
VVAQTKSAPIPHQVSLKQSSPGNADEHWALHFHPIEAHKSELHVLHAVSDKEENGVLHVQHLNMGMYDPQRSTSRPIAQFRSKAKAMAAMKDVHENVKLTGQFPHENCVDFTCKAVQHMATNNRIPQTAADDFKAHYDTHQEAVRTMTNTEENRKNAGVP